MPPLENIGSPVTPLGALSSGFRNFASAMSQQNRGQNDAASAALNREKTVSEQAKNQFIQSQMGGGGSETAPETLAQQYALYGLTAPKLSSVQGDVGVADYRPIEEQQFNPTPVGDARIRKYDTPTNGISIGADGSIQIGGTRMSKAPQDLKEYQGKNYSYGNRMQEAEKVITRLEGGISGKNFGESLGQVAQEAAVGTTVGNQFVSEEFQMFDQAKRDFVNAILRRESGAVISDAEFANAEKQYFPRPGDSKKVVEQKRRNRQLATKNILETGGVYPDEPAPQESTQVQRWRSEAEEAISRGADPDAVNARVDQLINDLGL